MSLSIILLSFKQKQWRETYHNQIAIIQQHTFLDKKDVTSLENVNNINYFFKQTKEQKIS